MLGRTVWRSYMDDYSVVLLVLKIKIHYMYLIL